MYHPGKIVKIFSGKSGDVKSADNTTQALVEMWDDNIFTFLVDSHIAGEVKEGHVVLVDYNPVSASTPVPKHMITKILTGKTAELTWNRYKKYNERNRKSSAVHQIVQHSQAPEYFG